MTPGKPTIVMTASTLPRWPGDTEPEFILQLAEALSADCRVLVLAPHCRGAATRERLGEVEVLRYRYAPAALERLAYGGGILANLQGAPWRWLLVPALILSQCAALRSLCRREPVALVHAHWIIPQGLAVALLRSLGWRGPPVLLTAHGADLFSLRRASRLKRWILRHCERLNVVSRAMLPEAQRLGVEPGSVLVRSLGVDLQQRFVVSAGAAQRAGLVFVGRLVEKKGVDWLLRAFARVDATHPDARLRIVGDGPLRGSLESLARELGCAERVRFEGAVANREIPALLNAARIAVVPSVVAADGDQEGLGLVAVEAMGCGCAVVCSDLPALRDVAANRDNALVVPAGDIAALANALGELLEDAELRARLAERGRESALARFDWAAVAGDYRAAYRALCA